MIRENLMKSHHQKKKNFSQSKLEWCKRIQSLVLVETYACGTKKDLTRKKEETKWKNMIETKQKVINFDDITKENAKEHKLNWPKIPDHLFRMLIIGGSGSAKTNTLFHLSL